MAIPQEFIERLREDTHLVEVVSELVTLKRIGKNFSGLCPFHAEKTPSFFVNDDEGFFHCFGCGKKGSVYDFLMESRGLSFPETVRLLAKRAGREVPESEQGGEDAAVKQRKLMLREVLRQAVAHYHSMLRSSPAGEFARSYLARRKVSDASIEKFQIGFAPEPESLVPIVLPKLTEQFSLSRQELLTLMQQAGVYSIKPNFSYETFRGRVIFPITKSEGSCIAMGGRILIDHPQRPKYVNSAESLLYTKSKTLFGLAQAMDVVRRTREVYLVEGYMDVVAFHESGIENAVAACGTAVTPDHVKVLKRLVDRVVVVFDGDSAGMRAAAHAFQVFINSGIEVVGVRLPEGDDPGSLHETGRGADLLKLVTEKREQIIDIFIAQRLSASDSDVKSPVQVGRLAKEIAKTLSRVENPVEREGLLRRVCEQLNVSPDAFTQLVAGEAARSDRRDQILERQGGAAQSEAAVGENTAIPPRRYVVLDTYCRQLLVAVLTEPGLARTLLDMPSLTGQAPVVSTLPENVRRCLDIFVSEPQMGLGSLRDADDALRAQITARLRGILEMENIEAEPLIIEGFRQITVGGTHLGRLLADASTVAARVSLRSEVVKIRERERSLDNAEEIAELAQEKLLRRRDLERLRKSS